MELTEPTDFDVLAAFRDGRNVGANVALELGLEPASVTTRLSRLVEHGLLARVGPSEQSGLYELTKRGEAALVYRDHYTDLGRDRFEAVVSDAADPAPAAGAD
mgnify:CR=1 FL=1